MKKQRCEGRTTTNPGYAAGARCLHSAGYQEGGKWYCHIHAPSRVTQRQKEREAVWRARGNLTAAKNNLEAQKVKIVKAVGDWFDAPLDDRRPDERLAEAWERFLELKDDLEEARARCQDLEGGD